MKRALRFAIVALGCIAAALLLLVWRRDRHRDIEVIDLGSRARAIALASPEGKSLVESYYKGPLGMAHLHVLGKSVTCELHIHEHTQEATIPVLGRPIVTQRFGAGTDIETKRDAYAEGTLIVSPPYCAHEWVNVSSVEDQANLVFTLGGPFPGNLFVAPDDPRILKSRAPAVFDAQAERSAFVGSPDRLRRIDIPGTMGELTAILIKDAFPVAPNPFGITFILAVAGRGQIDGTARRIDLGPEVLVVLRRAPAARIIADANDPLVVYEVRVPKEKT